MIQPTTRKEMFLHAIATGCECELEPVTREEQLLAQHAKREASGGGGVSSWNDLAGAPIMVVSAVSMNEDETFTVDKNYAEVNDALLGNKIVLMSLMGMPFIATGITLEKNDSVCFAEFAMLTDPNTKVLLDENGIVTVAESE